MNYKKLDETQKYPIAIPFLFFISGLTKHYLENFRGTWIYAYGGMACLIVCFLMFFFFFSQLNFNCSRLNYKVVRKSIVALIEFFRFSFSYRIIYCNTIRHRLIFRLNQFLKHKKTSSQSRRQLIKFHISKLYFFTSNQTYKVLKTLQELIFLIWFKNHAPQQ